MTQRRKTVLLVAGLLFALLITGWFGMRFVRRILYRPTHEPIRGWMDVGYVGRAYDVPPYVLYAALGLPDTGPRDRRPLSEIAKAQNRTTEEVIQILQERIARGPPWPPPPPRPTAPPPPPPPTPPPSQ